MRDLRIEEVKIMRAIAAVSRFNTKRTLRRGDVWGSGSVCWGEATTPVGRSRTLSTTVVHRGECTEERGAEEQHSRHRRREQAPESRTHCQAMEG